KQRFKGEYDKLRVDHNSRKADKRYIPLAAARENRVKIDWNATRYTRPKFLGRKELIAYPLEELRGYLDWTPFFQTWMMAGRFPGILEDPVVGVEAKKLYDDANRMLDAIIRDKSLQANGVIAFYEAVREGDDVSLSDGHASVGTFHFLRQQNKKAAGLPNFCLADFIAEEKGKDYLGMFAVTAGLGLEKIIQECKSRDDDYSEIMAKALADRLAEAFAECLHAKV